MVWMRRAVKTVIFDIYGLPAGTRTRLLCPPVGTLSRRGSGGSGVGPGPWWRPETLEAGQSKGSLRRSKSKSVAQPGA